MTAGNEVLSTYVFVTAIDLTGRSRILRVDTKTMIVMFYSRRFESRIRSRGQSTRSTATDGKFESARFRTHAVRVFSIFKILAAAEIDSTLSKSFPVSGHM